MLIRPRIIDSEASFRRKAYYFASPDLLDSAAASALMVAPDCFPDLLEKLQVFIQQAKETNAPPFLPGVSRTGEPITSKSDLATRYFSSTPMFIRCVQALSTKYRYDAHVEAFIACAKETGLYDARFIEWGSAATAHQIYPPGFGQKTAADLFNALVDALGKRCRSPVVREQMRQRKKEVERRLRSCSTYVKKLFAKYKRLVVIRLELGYLPELTGSIEFSHALDDLDRFLKNQYCNAIFNDMVGYIIKTEYGVKKGIHHHVFLFFNGDKRQGRYAEQIAKSIGEYWAGPVTRHKGDYFNRNEKKNIEGLSKRGVLGIGLIHASDDVLRDNLINLAIFYICKSDQYFKPKIDMDFRALRMGGDPFKKKPKLRRKGRSKPNSGHSGDSKA
uniref:YagK/YfjJ C-terminal domain-containing protein n=1 Tax=Dechloromonas aromatica (strain RCB) TaxID=159087 RepID=Q47FJ2_DECAR